MADGLTAAEVKERLDNDPDFINLRRYGYSLKRVVERYEDRGGCPDHIVAKALGMSEAELDMVYRRIIRKLRAGMGVDPDTGQED